MEFLEALVEKINKNEGLKRHDQFLCQIGFHTGNDNMLNVCIFSMYWGILTRFPQLSCHIYQVHFPGIDVQGSAFTCYFENLK